MSSLRAGPIMIQVRSKLLDAMLLGDAVAQQVLSNQEMTATDKETAITDIGILLNTINESVEVLNAWETSQPRIIQSEEEKVRLAADDRR